ncbi:uncharacterized protein CEXT_248131 [Caerostris extrusa]|uniref:Ig-like domain-containing protein n=1 Tax=Caerostris extrusa TaxID=172846 RepID=A0AAV4XSY0_CAEEX|nr:uncharacterized protein CEXT_248131 [Caerostris extrusa]
MQETVITPSPEAHVTDDRCRKKQPQPNTISIPAQSPCTSAGQTEASTRGSDAHQQDQPSADGRLPVHGVQRGAPAVSRRVMVSVHCYPHSLSLGHEPVNAQLVGSAVVVDELAAFLFIPVPPTISIPNQLVGTHPGANVTLLCTTEAYPRSLNYWTRIKGGVASDVGHGPRYQAASLSTMYKKYMTLTIFRVVRADYGVYRCHATNSLGTTDGAIRLYDIKDPNGEQGGNDPRRSSRDDHCDG